MSVIAVYLNGSVSGLACHLQMFNEDNDWSYVFNWLLLQLQFLRESIKSGILTSIIKIINSNCTDKCHFQCWYIIICCLYWHYVYFTGLLRRKKITFYGSYSERVAGLHDTCENICFSIVSGIVIAIDSQNFIYLIEIRYVKKGNWSEETKNAATASFSLY